MHRIIMFVTLVLCTVGCKSTGEPVKGELDSSSRASQEVVVDTPAEEIVLPEQTVATLELIEGRALARLTKPEHAILTVSSTVEQVQARVAEMVDIDQEVRKSIDEVFAVELSPAQSTEAMTRVGKVMGEVDEAHYRELEPFLKANGWPTISTYGEPTSGNVWLLVQHFDAHRDLQKWALDHMEPLLESGEVSPKNYAYLWDRVAVGEQRPQRYGTQGRCVGKDMWEPSELEDPAQVDARRQSVGLEPMVEYRKRFVGLCHGDQGV